GGVSRSVSRTLINCRRCRRPALHLSDQCEPRSRRSPAVLLPYSSMGSSNEQKGNAKALAYPARGPARNRGREHNLSHPEGDTELPQGTQGTRRDVPLATLPPTPKPRKDDSVLTLPQGKLLFYPAELDKRDLTRRIRPDTKTPPAPRFQHPYKRLHGRLQRVDRHSLLTNKNTKLIVRQRRKHGARITRRPRTNLGILSNNEGTRDSRDHRLRQGTTPPSRAQPRKRPPKEARPSHGPTRTVARQQKPQPTEHKAA
ncbi:hypothetical protein GE09DRAFT_1264008, partial [Coniochaeta sp. 2T2.1]